MDRETNSKIRAHINRENFVGRTPELEKIHKHVAAHHGENRGILLLSPPSAGISEFLRQVYDSLFNEQKIIPFYYAFGRYDKTAKDSAARFLQTFLLQVIAFRRNDQNLLNISPDVCEINELAAPTDAHWIHQLTNACNRESELNDEQSFVRQALSAPLRAAANDAQIVVLLDDLQNASEEIIENLKEIYTYSKTPFVFAGRRRFVFKALLGAAQKLDNVEILKLDFLQNSDANFLAEKLAEKFDVELNASTRDLIIRQLNAKPKFIESILSASARKKDLKTFQAFSQIYIDELSGGQIGKVYDDIFSGITTDSATRKKIISLLYEGFRSETQKVSSENWRESLALDENEVGSLINHLHVEEIINVNSGTISFPIDDEVLHNYLELKFRLENSDETRAQIIGEMLKNSLKRAPQLMTKIYRQNSVIGLNEILAAFNCQNISQSLIDYEDFKLHAKEINETAKIINLPQIIYTASGAAFYPPIAQVADENRVAVALGFETADYSQENEIAWIAAEVESKLEATRELTEFWCDRLEALAIICNFASYRLLLVAPEGFAPDAVEVLKQRNAYGASRQQIKFLKEHLKIDDLSTNKKSLSEYEMVLPMSENVELIAAGAIEEIAKKHHFAAKDITKIKTALVEAYINATEHSLSPDRKIYQKLTVDDDKIVITISNRGIKLAREKFVESAAPIEPENGRRGWGLKLMRTLMDEVNFEPVDDGTQISMVKYLR